MLSSFAKFRNPAEVLSEVSPKNFRFLMTAMILTFPPDSKLTLIKLNVFIASDARQRCMRILDPSSSYSCNPQDHTFPISACHLSGVDFLPERFYHFSP